jgi:hypothetical protein
MQKNWEHKKIITGKTRNFIINVKNLKIKRSTMMAGFLNKYYFMKCIYIEYHIFYFIKNNNIFLFGQNM